MEANTTKNKPNMPSLFFLNRIQVCLDNDSDLKSVCVFFNFNYLTLIPFQVGFINIDPIPTIIAYSQYTHSKGIINQRYFVLPKNLEAKNNNKKSKISLVKAKIDKYGVIGKFLIYETPMVKNSKLATIIIKPNV